MERILLALDLGACSDALARCGAQVSKLTDYEVVIAHALTPPLNRDFPSAEAACQAVARSIESSGGRVSPTRIIRVSAADELILTSARELSVDLVVMGWGAGQQLGSTARGVMRVAPASILLVGEEFTGPLHLDAANEGLLKLPIQDLPPLARLAVAARHLALVTPQGALLAELEPLSSRGVAS